jgi:hypothetical protein
MTVEEQAGSAVKERLIDWMRWRQASNVGVVGRLLAVVSVGVAPVNSAR